MTASVISSERDLVDLTVNNRDAVFRGVSDCANHRLVPSIGRNVPRSQLRALLRREREVMRLFKARGATYLERTDYTELDVLALAQHHGLRTRLMDWSTNPLVGLYFAVCANDDRDGGLYISRDRRAILGGEEDPYEPGGDFWVMPRHLSPRIIAQSGLFSIQRDPTKEFHGGRIARHIVPAALKPRLRGFLRKWDIHAERLFPGLESLALTLNEDLDAFAGRSAGVEVNPLPWTGNL